VIGLEIGERIAPLNVRLEVSDHAVGPQIRHADFELVGPPTQSISDLNLERGLPKDSAQWLAVERDFGDLVDLAQIQGHLASLPSPRIGYDERCEVGCRARKIPDALHRRIRPRTELLHAQLRRRTPSRGKNHPPGPLQPQRLLGQGRRLRLRSRDFRTAEHDEHGTEGIEVQIDSGVLILRSIDRRHHGAGGRIPQLGMLAPHAKAAGRGDRSLVAVGDEIDLRLSRAPVRPNEIRVAPWERVREVRRHSPSPEHLLGRLTPMHAAFAVGVLLHGLSVDPTPHGLRDRVDLSITSRMVAEARRSSRPRSDHGGSGGHQVRDLAHDGERQAISGTGQDQQPISHAPGQEELAVLHRSLVQDFGVQPVIRVPLRHRRIRHLPRSHAYRRAFTIVVGDVRHRHALLQ
jgi:hypothetical protein